MRGSGKTQVRTSGQIHTKQEDRHNEILINYRHSESWMDESGNEKGNQKVEYSEGHENPLYQHVR